jgi:hypothetical protein
MDGWMAGWLDGWMAGWVDGCTGACCWVGALQKSMLGLSVNALLLLLLLLPSLPAWMSQMGQMGQPFFLFIDQFWPGWGCRSSPLLLLGGSPLRQGKGKGGTGLGADGAWTGVQEWR